VTRPPSRTSNWSGASSARAANLGHLDRAGELAGPGALTGFFIVRASTDSEAATIVHTCPHVKYGGHVELRRVME